jgi:AcrR family transcriptional regulator
VTVAPTSTDRRLSRSAREARILDTAQRLFYARGVHEVGMDELVRETGLGKATVYRLYPTKDALVAAYLARLAATILDEIDSVAADSPDPSRALISVLAAVEQDLRRPEFRGCAFNNASIEFDDPAHPARIEARRYREQLAARLTELAQQLAGRRRGRQLGAQLAVLVDGAYTSAAHLGPDGPAATGLKLARDLVRAERTTATARPS